MEEKEHRTKNIKFCAFLRLNKVHPAEVKKLSRGKGEFVYYMEEERWDNFKILFNQSQYIEYAHCLEAIKDLCY
jgi:hypothetical protein